MSQMPRLERATSYQFDIYMAGDIEAAKRVCRAYCDEVGFCVNVSPTDFIYTGGEESGFKVGLINYPRFPTDFQATLWRHAHRLGDQLRAALGQESYTIVGPEMTVWKSWREEDLIDVYP
jgi:hypothetical protein